jgi:hypothetical protein
MMTVADASEMMALAGADASGMMAGAGASTTCTVVATGRDAATALVTGETLRDLAAVAALTNV